MTACGLRVGRVVRRVLFFFFSSRRRHTRYIGDWSSDVCSSDLAVMISAQAIPPPRLLTARPGLMAATSSTIAPFRTRSEERRVGKEGRSRRAPDESHKKDRKSVAEGRTQASKRVETNEHRSTVQ